jgi:hypothetical protein
VRVSPRGRIRASLTAGAFALLALVAFNGLVAGYYVLAGAALAVWIAAFLIWLRARRMTR